MGVFFHILSTGGGGGAGASRVTRYIAERDRDLAREGSDSRPLFSEDREGLSYRRADRILDPTEARPEKNDLIHFSVMIEEEEFDQLGADEKEKQERFKNIIREGMKGMAAELNVERLTWVAGIHRNAKNPHAHVVMRKDALERATHREKRIGRIRKSLLPHKGIEQGIATIVPGKIGERFLDALQKQQELHRGRNNEQSRAGALWDQLVRNMQERREPKIELVSTQAPIEKTARLATAPRTHPQDVRGGQTVGARRASVEFTPREIAASWNADSLLVDDSLHAYRVALGKQVELRIRLTFAQVWYDRAVEHGETFRFNVLDQSTAAERKISEVDVQRRASARATRATRTTQGDHFLRNQAIETDLDRHRQTLQQLAEAREAKIAALQKDIAGLAGRIAKTGRNVVAAWQSHSDQHLTPLLSRHTLSELQEQAIKLDLPDQTLELEQLRVVLAREHSAPLRTDAEAAKLAAQLNVARADFMARDAQLEKFEASVHLTSYEVHEERWSLAGLDKQIYRRAEDAKLIPARAARLDLRSLARLNYSAAERQQAIADVKHLNYVRAEIVSQIEGRREPLIEGRSLANQVVDILESAYHTEERTRARTGADMPEANYEAHQIKALEASAETLREPLLLREVHQWEKTGERDDGIDWQGRAAAREITSGIGVAESHERLQHFLESRHVASLHVGNHHTATLRDVEARTLTEYLARAISETRADRDYRHSVKVAAREHHGRLVNDYEQAKLYHETARELASQTKDHEPKFTDKEKINLEIYAERLNDEAERERYLELARGESHSQERAASVSRSR